MNESGWAQFGILLVAIAGFAFQWFRESRNRRWAQEDAEQKADEVKRAAAHEADRVRDAAIAAAAQVQRSAAETAETLRLLLEETKNQAQAAYHEANNINMKLASADERWGSLIKEAIGGSEEVLHRVDETTQETHGLVKKLGGDGNSENGP